MSMIEIATARLVLRPLKTSDWPLYKKLLRCTITTQYLPKQAPYSDDEIMSIMQARINHWQQHGFGTFTMLDAATNELIGYVGVQMANENQADIRYGLLPSKTRQGYTKEAAEACLQWTLANTSLTQIFGVALAENLASINTLKTIGMQSCEDHGLYDADNLLYFSNC